jgi:hypothetical protein
MRPLVSIIPRASNGMRAELYQIADGGGIDSVWISRGRR